MSERFLVMKMVNVGDSYREITKKTGVLSAAVTRVAHWLNYGKSGYKMMLKKLGILK